MRRFIFIILATVILVFLSPTVLAQNYPNILLEAQVLENVPGPLNDLFNAFQKININIKLPFLERAFQQGIPGSSGDGAGGVISDLTNLFYQISNWFQNKIGVSLIDILKAIGNFIIWVLEFIVKLIKAGLSFIQS